MIPISICLFRDGPISYWIASADRQFWFAFVNEDREASSKQYMLGDHLSKEKATQRVQEFRSLDSL
jgi:hypothetical protein